MSPQPAQKGRRRPERHAVSQDNTRGDRYQCRCGWTGTLEEVSPHLAGTQWTQR